MSKYEWLSVPKEVNWIATDSSGSVFGYDVEPEYKEWGEVHTLHRFPLFSAQELD